MMFYRFILPGGAYGGERSEYACADCYHRALDMYECVRRIEAYQARPDERCPKCGKAEVREGRGL